MSNAYGEMHFWNFDSIQQFGSYALSEIDKVCRNNQIPYCVAYGTMLGAVRHQNSIPWDFDADIYIPAQEILRFVKVAREQLPDDLWVDFYDVNPNYIYSYPRVGKKGFSTDGLHIDVFELYGLPRGEKEEKKHLHKIEWLRILLALKSNVYDPSRLPEIDKWRKSRIFRILIKRYAASMSREQIIRKLEEAGGQYNLVEDCDHVYDGFRIFPASWFASECDAEYDGHILRIPVGTEGYLKQSYGDYMSYPKDRFYQFVRYSLVEKDIPRGRVAYIADFSNLSADMLEELETLYWESGSIVAVVNAYLLPEAEREKAKKTALALKYFNKVFVNDIGEAEEANILNMISADQVIYRK